jgi:hypothetical protein
MDYQAPGRTRRSFSPPCGSYTFAVAVRQYLADVIGWQLFGDFAQKAPHFCIASFMVVELVAVDLYQKFHSVTSGCAPFGAWRGRSGWVTLRQCARRRALLALNSVDKTMPLRSGWLVPGPH